MVSADERRELVREALLRVLEANGSEFGLGAAALSILVGRFGVTAGQDEVRLEMQYIVEKGMANPVRKLLSPEVRVWQISALGRDWLAGAR